MTDFRVGDRVYIPDHDDFVAVVRGKTGIITEIDLDDHDQFNHLVKVDGAPSPRWRFRSPDLIPFATFESVEAVDAYLEEP